jgi:hypothetical protein
MQIQATPSYLINKSISNMDPSRPLGPPQGGLYRFASGVRDMPFAHPLISAGIALTPVIGTAAIVQYAGISAYATARDVLHLAPTAARLFEQLGRGRPEFTAPMVDTRAAMSMRQASLRALHDSGYFLRNVIGREARLMHR